MEHFRSKTILELRNYVTANVCDSQVQQQNALLFQELSTINYSTWDIMMALQMRAQVVNIAKLSQSQAQLQA